jgi:Ca-activated chloride channel family protein
MFSKVRPVIYSLIVLFGLSFSPAEYNSLIAPRAADDDIRIDVAKGGQVRVQNQFGDVRAEVWQNNFVSVSADIVGARLSRSPIVIDNKGSVLSISVFRTPVDPVATINLKVKVPESSRLGVITGAGQIQLLGLANTATLKSRSGAITSTFNLGSDTEINARTSRGSIKTRLGDSGTEETAGQTFQQRVGSGGHGLDVESESGQILIGYVGVRAVPEPALSAPTPRAAGVPAIPATNNELDEGDVIRVDSQLVTLNMSVVDRSTSRGVMGLRQSDFRLYEDGQEQQLVQFDSAAAPFDLILLIDLSGSTKEKVELIRASARRFVNAARPADRISIITFAGEPKLISEPIVDRQLLRERIATIDTARGDTKLYDATEFAMNEVTKVPKRSRRTAIVLMSDGLDGTIPGVSGQIGSTRPYDELLRTIQEFDGVLYTLWLNTRYVALHPNDTQPEAFDEGHDRMAEMAEAGGGIFSEVKSLQDLAGAYEQVVADLGTVYSLSYKPSNSLRDGKFRAIRINVNRPNAVARGKRGYYAN